MEIPFRRGPRRNGAPGGSPSGRREGRGNLPVFFAGATLVMLLAMTVGTAFVVRTVVERQSEDRFRAFVAQSSNSLAAEVSATVTEAGALEGLFINSHEVTLAGFETFVDGLRKAGLSASTVEFVPRVRAEDAVSFEEAIRAQGLAGFRMDLSSGRDELFPVALVDPPVSNPAELGANLGDEPAFREAMEAAIERGQPTASEPAPFPGSDRSDPTFGVFAPIYRAGEPVLMAAERRAALLGYGVAVYEAPAFLEGPLARAGLDGINVSAADIGSPAEAADPVTLLASSPTDSLRGSRAAAVVAVAGRAWRLDFRSRPWFGLSAIERNAWVIVLGAGLAITLIATGSSYSLVSSQQSARSNLKLLSAQLSVFLDSALEGILLVDRDRRVVWANQAFADAFGYEHAHDLPGRLSPGLERNAVSTPDDDDRFAQRIEEIYADEGLTVPAEDIDLFRPAAVTYSRTSVPVTDERGEYRGRLWVYRDVTAERAAEHAKGAFVSMVSHELRTPLTSVIGFLELVLGGAAGPVTAEAARLLGMARRSSERLRRLVNDILDVSRLEGGMRVELAPAALPPIVSELLDNVRGEFDAHGLTLEVDVPAGLPPVLADPTRLFQVLTNLLTNACRYTPEGGRVTLSARERDGMVETRVADTGVGIPPEDRERVFERFVRVDSGRHRPAGSTGLGLAIARSLTELQGGSIELQSEVGVGTVFIVRLPVATEEVASPAAA